MARWVVGFIEAIYILMKTSVSADGHILIPAELRQQDDLQPGQELEIERIRRGEYRLSRIPIQRNVGLVDWLLACPEKGYFVPIEPESTESHLT